MNNLIAESKVNPQIYLQIIMNLLSILKLGTSQMVEKQASGRAWIKLSTFNGRKSETNSQRALARVQAAGSRHLPGAHPPPPPYLRKETDLSERRSFLSPVETSLPVQSLSQ